MDFLLVISKNRLHPKVVSTKTQVGAIPSCAVFLQDLIEAIHKHALVLEVYWDVLIAYVSAAIFNGYFFFQHNCSRSASSSHSKFPQNRILQFVVASYWGQMCSPDIFFRTFFVPTLMVQKESFSSESSILSTFPTLHFILVATSYQKLCRLLNLVNAKCQSCNSCG